MIMLKQGNSPNILTETWLCDTLEEINELPNNTPVGSLVLVPLDTGLVIKIKNNAGIWKEI